MTDGLEPLDDRRAALLAATLVGAVVIVLGFGSGIGSVLSHDAASRSGSGGRDLGTVVQPDEVAVGTAPSGGTTPLDGLRRISATTTALTEPVLTSAPSAGTAVVTTGGSSAPVTTPSTAGATTPTVTSTCSSGGLPAAALTPFLVHLDKAHLEEGPGQQVGQALELDQYVKTHTVLVEAMLQPVVDGVLAALQGLPPFWSHVDKAHLEESPGEQVGQALEVDQYVKTHTVLVEDMLDPVLGAVTGAGCQG